MRCPRCGADVQIPPAAAYPGPARQMTLTCPNGHELMLESTFIPDPPAEERPESG